MRYRASVRTLSILATVGVVGGAGTVAGALRWAKPAAVAAKPATHPHSAGTAKRVTGPDPAGNPKPNTPPDSAGNPVHVKVMTFNVCGDRAAKVVWTYGDGRTKTVCSSTGNTAEMARGIDGYMKAGGMFGDASTTHVLFLQEVCWADIKRLKTYDNVKNNHWRFRFKAVRDRGTMNRPTKTWHNRKCRSGRGGFGIAVGVDRAASFTKYMFHHYPKGNDGYGHKDTRQPLICGTTTASHIRFCGAHLTPGAGSSGIRLYQTKGLVKRAGTGNRVIVGGDLNSRPADPDLKPLYWHYQECDRARHGTFQSKSALIKLDYVFVTKNARADGSVTPNDVSLSDHRPLISHIAFP